MGKTQREKEISATGHTLGVKPRETGLIEEQGEYYVLNEREEIIIFVHPEAGVLVGPESIWSDSEG